MASPRILLVDESPAMLDALVEMLQEDFHIVGALSDGALVMDQLQELNPDIIVLDVSLKSLSGFDLIQRLHKRGCDVKFLFLSSYETIDFVRAACDCGASGYVYKSRLGSDLCDALHAIARGERFFASNVSPVS